MEGSHKQNLCKISQSLGILNKLKHILPIHSKTLIFSSLILSHLTFGILAWGYTCERITNYKNKQKECVRTITTNKYNAHTEPIFKRLNLLKVEDIFKLQVLKFYFKFKNSSLPHYLQSLPLQHNQDIHNHNTQLSLKIHQLKTNHEYAQQCIRNNLPQIVNDTPKCITDKVETHSLQGFGNYAKQYILKPYSVTCLIGNCYICSRQTES